MIIGRVIGTVVATMKHPAYQARKLLLVQPMVLAGQSESEAFVAIDAADAGEGDAVLVLREGGGARQVTQIDNAPIISVIVGVLDSVTVDKSLVQDAETNSRY